MIEVDVILRTRCRSQVVHNRGHGFSKRFTLQGCTNCPLQTSRVRPVSGWLGDRLKLRNVRVPLTNHAQLRVAPGESTPNSKAGHALESVSTVRLRTVSHTRIFRGPLARQVWTN